MPVIDIRAHGGTYAAGKYKKGGEYTDEQVKIVTTKGNGKPYWENLQYSVQKVAATRNYVFAAVGTALYKYNGDGTGATTLFNFGGNHFISDIAANDNNYAFTDTDTSSGGLRYGNELSGIIWQKISDSSPYFYTSATAVDMNDAGEVVYGTGWVGSSAKTVHKFTATGSAVWSASLSSDSTKAICHLPDGGAAIVKTSNQIEIVNSSGQIVKTFSTGEGDIQCITADSDGYIYVVVRNTSNNKTLVRKIDLSSYTVIKETVLGSSNHIIYKMAVKGDYVYVPFSNNIVKLDKSNLGIVAFFPQPETDYPIFALFVNNQFDLFLANTKLRKIDVKQFYTLK
jgi:hypothetical protein